MTTEIGNIHEWYLPEHIKEFNDHEQRVIDDHFETMPEPLKGSVVLVFLKENEQPIACGIFCPDCGTLSFKVTPGIEVDRYHAVVNLTPSIVLHCCGYHGFLENNLYRKV